MNSFFNLVFFLFLSSFVYANDPECPKLVHEVKNDLCAISKCPGEYLCCSLEDNKAACLPKNRDFSKCKYDKDAIETQVFENCFKSGCPKTKICCPKVTGGSNCQDFFDE